MSRDEGSATVYVSLLAVLVTVVGAVALVLGRVAVHRARAAAAADLAALAAAGRQQRGADVACRRAAEIAAAHGAGLESCVWAGPVVKVRVRLEVTGMLWLSDGSVHAESRAGPQE